MTPEEVLLRCCRTCPDYSSACDRHIEEAITLARAEGRNAALEEAAQLAGWPMLMPHDAEPVQRAIRALIKQEPRRQAPPDALAQARSEGRAAALEAAARKAEAFPWGYERRVGEPLAIPEEIAAGIRSLLNQGRDEVAPGPEITSKSPATDTEAK